MGAAVEDDIHLTVGAIRHSHDDRKEGDAGKTGARRVMRRRLNRALKRLHLKTQEEAEREIETALAARMSLGVRPAADLGVEEEVDPMRRHSSVGERKEDDGAGTGIQIRAAEATAVEEEEEAGRSAMPRALNLSELPPVEGLSLDVDMDEPTAEAPADLDARGDDVLELAVLQAKLEMDQAIAQELRNDVGPNGRREGGAEEARWQHRRLKRLRRLTHRHRRARRVGNLGQHQW